MSTGTLDGKTAIVTGGGQGMGRTMALALVKAGARVTIVDLDDQALASVAREAPGTGGAARTIVADVTREDSATRVIKETLESFNRIDILVNNAGIGQETIRPNFLAEPLKFWEVEPARWRRVLDVNATAQFLLARAVVPHMLGHGWGRIINVTTSLDTMIRRGFAPYGPSKAANEAHVAIMAEDLAGTGVTANVLVPGGPVNTRMVPAASVANRASLIQPDVMVAPLLWLTSPASDGVTGRRFIAALWDKTLPPAQAAEKAGAPAAWASLGRQAIYPKG